MEGRELLTDVSAWSRVGRGRVFQFFALDVEIQEWLLEALPDEYAPYHLLGYDRLAGPIDFTFRLEITDLAASRQRMPEKGSLSHLWLWSESITLDLPLSVRPGIDGFFVINGLIGLQLGRLGPGGRIDDSSIDSVPRVMNRYTAEVVHHREYEKLFERLVRLLRKRLVYACTAESRNGEKREISWLKMTEAADAAYASGVPFRHAPGRRLK